MLCRNYQAVPQCAARVTEPGKRSVLWSPNVCFEGLIYLRSSLIGHEPRACRPPSLIAWSSRGRLKGFRCVKIRPFVFCRKILADRSGNWNVFRASWIGTGIHNDDSRHGPVEQLNK
jgi:hypothetical protein